MSLSITDLQAALEEYNAAVRDARMTALDARARITRALAALDEVRDEILQRRRRAEKRAAKRRS